MERKSKDLERQCDTKGKGIDFRIKGLEFLHHMNYVTFVRLFHFFDYHLSYLQNGNTEHIAYTHF